jgi:APA family basic amino acid/polyamine antiporter
MIPAAVGRGAPLARRIGLGRIPVVDGETRLRRSLRVFDGLAMVVGITVGSGIFRTPGLVAARLGRPWLTFVAWILGGMVSLVGALIFAELSTRHPRAGGKYVYAGEAFGPRVAFAIGSLEAGIYCVAIAAMGVVCGEYLARLVGAKESVIPVFGACLVLLLVGVNLAGVAFGRWTQNLATAAKVLALAGVVVVSAFAGSGTRWTSSSLPGAPKGLAVLGALALAFQPVLWTYYGYLDASKIAEEVVDPTRALPRIFLWCIGLVTGLYLLLNAAFLNVLPLDQIAASPLVAGDVMARLFGGWAGSATALLALLVVLACLNANVFVTPRVVYGLARDGLAPRVLARVNRGGTPWIATLVVGAVSVVLAATGSFSRLLSLAILLILVTDGFMVIVLFRLRMRDPDSPFRMPLYPWLAWLFLAIYALLFAAGAADQPGLACISAATLAAAYGMARMTVISRGADRAE